MGASVWSSTLLVNMLLFTLSSLLAFSQTQQSGSDWCQDWQNEMGRDAGIMCACISGSKLEQKTKEAYQQCSYLAESGSGIPAGRSIFGSGMPAGSGSGMPAEAGSGMPAGRSIFGSAQMRKTSDGQCPPVAEMGIAVNDPNPMYSDDSMKDCVLAAMDPLVTGVASRGKRITKALDSIIVPNVLDFFSYGDNTKEKWTNCYEMNGYRNDMMKKADECEYSEDEAKAMKFYGARWDAFWCLTTHLRNACEEGLWEMTMGK